MPCACQVTSNHYEPLLPPMDPMKPEDATKEGTNGESDNGETVSGDGAPTHEDEDDGAGVGISPRPRRRHGKDDDKEAGGDEDDERGDGEGGASGRQDEASENRTKPSKPLMDESRRLRFAKMPWADAMEKMKDSEVDELVAYHWVTYKKRNPRAEGQPKKKEAKVNFLKRLASGQGDGHLDPYREAASDKVRAAFGLPTHQDLEDARKKLSYPRLPSVHEMWVKDPIKAPKDPNKGTKIDGVTWKYARCSLCTTACSFSHVQLCCVLAGSAYWLKKTGMDYNERYAVYAQLYEEYRAECEIDGVTPKPKIRWRCGYHAIDATKTIEKQYQELRKLTAEGIVLQSPAENVPSTGRRGVLWQTNAIELVPAKTLVCYQAALVHALATPLQQLGKSHGLEPRVLRSVPYQRALCYRHPSSPVPQVPARTWRSSKLLRGQHDDGASRLPPAQVGRRPW